MLLNTRGLLDKYDVKMAGYWSSSFTCVYGPKRHWSSYTGKKRDRYPVTMTNWFSPNKGSTIWQKEQVRQQRDTASSHERVRWPHLAISGSPSQCSIYIWFILPTLRSCHNIKIAILHLSYFLTPPLMNFTHFTDEFFVKLSSAALLLNKTIL